MYGEPYLCYLGRAFPDSPWVLPAQHWPLGLMVIPGWPGTRFEASHFPAVEPELLPLWSSLQSSPQPAWFSGTLWQASDKFPSPGRTLEQKSRVRHRPQHSGWPVSWKRSWSPQRRGLTGSSFLSLGQNTLCSIPSEPRHQPFGGF